MLQQITVSGPSPSPTSVFNTPDPLALESLHVAWNTFDVTFAALVVVGLALFVAFIALGVTISDARTNSKQLKMLIEERALKPAVTLLWANGETREVFEVPRSAVFEDVGYVAVPIRAQNDGTLAATNTTVNLIIPREAKVRTEMLRGVQMKLGQPDWKSITEIHAAGIFAHERRDVEKDGSRNDDWDIGTIKKKGFKTFGKLMILLPEGEHPIRWTTNCDEGFITEGALTLEVHFEPNPVTESSNR